MWLLNMAALSLFAVDTFGVKKFVQEHDLADRMPRLVP